MPECIVCEEEINVDEVCDDCNKIYKKVLGKTFKSEEEISESLQFLEPFLRRRLGNEMHLYLYGP